MQKIRNQFNETTMIFQTAHYDPNLHNEEERTYAAMCIWEYWLEFKPKIYVEKRNKVGAQEVREIAMNLAPTVLTIFDHLKKMEVHNSSVDLGPFDWDVVPGICSILPDEYLKGEAHPLDVPVGSSLEQLSDAFLCHTH